MMSENNMSEKGNFLSLKFIMIASAILLFLTPGLAMAQNTPTPSSIWDFFGDGVGDPYSSVFLNQMFGPLFPSASNSAADSVFGSIISYFNVIVLLVGGMMFFYNVTIGVMQSAHEGQVLGSRWSSLWAPLRVVLAVGMLVPVNEGYNLAQSGVAYVVQGSTKMASAVWGVTAKLVLSDDIPIASSFTNFDTGVMTNMYEQAACMTTLEQQVIVANPNASVGYVSSLSDADDGNRFHYQSAINNGSEWVDHGVCGSWSTPRTPSYLDAVVAGFEEDTVEDSHITREQANLILQTFSNGHRDIMIKISSDMRSLTDSKYGEIMTNNTPSASIASKIATFHTEATSELRKLVSNVKDLATDPNNGVDRPREALLNRINGSNACFEDDGSHNASSDRSASVACYGEGWMGAGTWYILMAKVNNELTSLTDARSSTSTGTYKSGSIWGDDDVFRSAGGQGSGFFGGVRASDTSSMPSVEQSLEALQKYKDLFTRSAIELAALGYQIPTDVMTSINRDVSGNPEGFWSKIMDDEKMASVTRGIMSSFDPGNSGDPMINIISTGHLVLGFGSVMLTAAALTGPLGIGVGASIALLPVYSLFLAAGVSLSFILPIMPFLYWVLAISGYFLLIAEAVIAVNLWALSHLRMDGEGISGETGRQGWLMVLALFMTPTLMVFGFVIGMGLFRVVSDLLSAGMFYAISGLVGASPILWLFGTLGYTILMVTSYGILLERSFSLVSEFPGRVMRWMGGSNVDLGGGEGGIKIAAGAAIAGLNAAGNQMEAGVKKFIGGSDGKGKDSAGRAVGDKARGSRGVSKSR